MPDPQSNWRTCYAELAPKLRLYARQWLASTADAEDVVQSAFVKFWRRQPDAPREHWPLLFPAVRSAALDLLRRDQRRARREQTAQPDEPAWFDTDTAQTETGQLLELALQKLPEPQREVVMLKLWGDLTFQQIADTLGESLNTVASRYRYALDALRRIIKPHQYERI